MMVKGGQQEGTNRYKKADTHCRTIFLDLEMKPLIGKDNFIKKAPKNWELFNP